LLTRGLLQLAVFCFFSGIARSRKHREQCEQREHLGRMGQMGHLERAGWSLVFGLWSLVFGLWSLVFGHGSLRKWFSIIGNVPNCQLLTGPLLLG
jgi:hypothetical protein